MAQGVATALTLLFVISRSIVGVRRSDLKEFGEKIDALEAQINRQNGRIGKLEEWRVSTMEPFMERVFATLDELRLTLKEMNVAQSEIREAIAEIRGVVPLVRVQGAPRSRKR